MSGLLDEIKAQKWFYEFSLPDGSRTESYLPDFARAVHVTREKALRHYLDSFDQCGLTALDVSCHEGYFSLVLREFFASVTGVDKNEDSLKKARLITDLLGHPEIKLVNSPLEQVEARQAADFVLCFGLLYHVENPVEIIRKLAKLTGKTLCLETQVLPYEISGPIEDGSYLWYRYLQGLFGLCADYAGSAEGGLTDVSLVPSRAAVDFLLRQAGFKSVEFYQPAQDDYEQFLRGHRVIVLATK